MIAHLLRYQGLAVDDYSVALDALDLDYPRLSLNEGFTVGPHQT